MSRKAYFTQCFISFSVLSLLLILIRFVFCALDIKLLTGWGFPSADVVGDRKRYIFAFESFLIRESRGTLSITGASKLQHKINSIYNSLISYWSLIYCKSYQNDGNQRRESCSWIDWKRNRIILPVLNVFRSCLASFFRFPRPISSVHNTFYTLDSLEDCINNFYTFWIEIRMAIHGYSRDCIKHIFFRKERCVIWSKYYSYFAYSKQC